MSSTSADGSALARVVVRRFILFVILNAHDDDLLYSSVIDIVKITYCSTQAPALFGDSSLLLTAATLGTRVVDAVPSVGS